MPLLTVTLVKLCNRCLEQKPMHATRLKGPITKQLGLAKFAESKPATTMSPQFSNFGGIQ
jgi:hypothetical protein